MKALVSGCTGQDGSYLCELLLEKGYEVHGFIRRSSTPNTWRIDGIIDKLQLHYGDLTDGTDIANLISEVKPDEIYNLGAQSHVRVSFDSPVYTAQTNALGPLRILETLKNKGIKYYQASSSEMFGKVFETPQKVSTPFNPQSPYGISKTFAFFATKAYRTAYDMFAVNGILFNHESPRRGETFVTQKVVQAFRKMKEGKLEKLHVGNIYTKRDWGYAKDYVQAIYMMMQHDKPDDWLIASGETHTVKEMIDWVGALNGYSLSWDGEGMDTIARDTQTQKVIIEVDPKYYRPNEVDILLGDPLKANTELGWKPTVDFHKLLEIMVKGDKEYAERRGST